MGLLMISIAANFAIGTAWYLDSNHKNGELVDGCYASFYLGKLVATKGGFPSHREIQGIPTHLTLLPSSAPEKAVRYRKGFLGHEWIELTVDSNGNVYVRTTDQ